MYKYIINPKSGRKVSIYGKLGRKILHKYIQKGSGVKQVNQSLNIICIQWQKNYLKNVCIENSDSCINLCQQPDFLKVLFHPNTFQNLFEAKKIIKSLDVIINNPLESCESFVKKTWKACNKKCFKHLFTLIEKEITSTAYMLRVISNSLISIDNNVTLSFEYDNQPLTGIWLEDCHKFKIKDLENKSPRLILGFGPSAAGKTYWAENIIKIVNQSSPDFPKGFISVDGGTARELSEIYQFTINSLSYSNLGGFTNLVTAGMGRTKSLFKASKIKKAMIKYLKTQKNLGVRISLYVPITLGGCIMNCYSSYKPFIDITGDKQWIGLLIYQHRKGLECPNKEKYRCIGCTESGKSREMEEGKKYSSKAYNNSMSNGKKALIRAKGGKLIIHNTGGYKYRNEEGNLVFAKSIVTEFPINGKYLLKNISNNFNCAYVREGSGDCPLV
jgi:hypothetical protein